jgi:hypothetical protein
LSEQRSLSPRKRTLAGVKLLSTYAKATDLMLTLSDSFVGPENLKPSSLSATVRKKSYFVG